MRQITDEERDLLLALKASHAANGMHASMQAGLPTGRASQMSATRSCPHPPAHPPSSTASTSSTLLTGFQASPGTRSCPGASWPAPMPDTCSGGKLGRTGRDQTRFNNCTEQRQAAVVSQQSAAACRQQQHASNGRSSAGGSSMPAAVTAGGVLTSSAFWPSVPLPPPSRSLSASLYTSSILQAGRQAGKCVTMC